MQTLTNEHSFDLLYEWSRVFDQGEQTVVDLLEEIKRMGIGPDLMEYFHKNVPHATERDVSIFLRGALAFAGYFAELALESSAGRR